MRPLLALLAVAGFGLAQQPNEQLQRLFKQYYEDRLRDEPEVATYRGRAEYNDRWTDCSRTAIERRAKARQDYLDRLRPFLKARLSEQDNLSTRLLVYLLEREVDTDALNNYLLGMGPLNGAHVNVYRTIDVMPRNTVRDYENIIARLNAVPAYVDQNIALFNDAISSGLVQPSVVIDRVLAQLRSQAAQDVNGTDLLAAFRKMPAAIPDAESRRLSAQAATAYTETFLPAWRRFADFVEKTYAPKARPAIGLSSVPDGQALYAAQVRSMTTTAFTPQQIHDLGKKEVQRLETEMQAIAREAGLSTTNEYEKNLDGSPDQHFHSKDEMLAYCRNIAKLVEPELPRLFLRIPRLLYGIRAIPPAVEAATASNAQSPSPDFSRPGWFNLNTFQPEKQVKYNKEALVLHEAVPGHIFQGSIALELNGLPEFRKLGGGLSAYGEGWGLYVESLGAELGVYRDPSSRFGRLSSERFRAVRLVVDTGMHALGWSRAQAVDYFTTHAPANSLAEIDRYISWPAQALSYKMGQLAILELRRKAERELGPKFDIREFHDVVLRNGRLPMELLGEIVDAYIREKRG